MARSTHLTDLPKDGIKLSYIINTFIPDCKEKYSLNYDITTADMKPNVIMLETVNKSYCDYLKTIPEHATSVNTAQVFISHTWASSFLLVIETLAEHFSGNLDVFIWFDIFSVNQHVRFDSSWWDSAFKNAITVFKHTVMLMSPWDNPKALTRAWCLFELACTLESSSKFEIAMSQKDKMSLLELINQKGYNAIEKMLSNIDVEHSEASEETDKERIMDYVRKSKGGFPKINTLAFKHIRKWILGTVESTLELGQMTDYDSMLMKSRLAEIYRREGEIQKANGIFLELRRDGKNSTASWIAEMQRSVTDLHLGRSMEAYEDFKRILDQANQSDGNTYLKYDLTRFISYSLQGQGKHGEARKWLQKCKQEFSSLFEHNALHDVASEYFNWGRYDEAIEIYQNQICSITGMEKPYSLEKLKVVTPNTLFVVNNLGNVYWNDGEWDLAREHFKFCESKRQTWYGDVDENNRNVHPTVKSVKIQLEWFYKIQHISMCIYISYIPTTLILFTLCTSFLEYVCYLFCYLLCIFSIFFFYFFYELSIYFNVLLPSFHYIEESGIYRQLLPPKWLTTLFSNRHMKRYILMYLGPYIYVISRKLCDEEHRTIAEFSLKVTAVAYISVYGTLFLILNCLFYLLCCCC
jgi:tetratricopeptide (TPR) repeat protein